MTNGHVKKHQWIRNLILFVKAHEHFKTHLIFILPINDSTENLFQSLSNFVNQYLFIIYNEQYNSRLCSCYYST